MSFVNKAAFRIAGPLFSWALLLQDHDVSSTAGMLKFDKGSAFGLTMESKKEEMKEEEKQEAPIQNFVLILLGHAIAPNKVNEAYQSLCGDKKDTNCLVYNTSRMDHCTTGYSFGKETMVDFMSRTKRMDHPVWTHAATSATVPSQEEFLVNVKKIKLEVVAALRGDPKVWGVDAIPKEATLTFLANLHGFQRGESFEHLMQDYAQNAWKNIHNDTGLLRDPEPSRIPKPDYIYDYGESENGWVTTDAQVQWGGDLYRRNFFKKRENGYDDTKHKLKPDEYVTLHAEELVHAMKKTSFKKTALLFISCYSGAMMAPFKVEESFLKEKGQEWFLLTTPWGDSTRAQGGWTPFNKAEEIFEPKKESWVQGISEIAHNHVKSFVAMQLPWLMSRLCDGNPFGKGHQTEAAKPADQSW